ncbi:tumor necrosis factor receptor family protein [Paenarthrobacter histidinolovorans]
MSVAAVSLLAQVIPALLVAGLLGPLFLGFQIEWPERFLYASQIVTVVLAEGVCLYYAVLNEPMPAPWAWVVLLACMYLLLGIVSGVIVWARKTDQERSDLTKTKNKNAKANSRRGRRRGTGRIGDKQ